MTTPERITRALASIPPDDERIIYDTLHCTLCYGHVERQGVDHEPDCPYRLAVEWVAANPERAS